MQKRTRSLVALAVAGLTVVPSLSGAAFAQGKMMGGKMMMHKKMMGMSSSDKMMMHNMMMKMSMRDRKAMMGMSASEMRACMRMCHMSMMRKGHMMKSGMMMHKKM